MNSHEIEAEFENWKKSENDICYDGKQAQYDYDGATAEDEDNADWFKPKKGGKRIG